MHNDNPDNHATRQTSATAPAADRPRTSGSPQDDPLIAGMTAFVKMLEERLPRARQRIEAEDIPDDVPRFEVWR